MKQSKVMLTAFCPYCSLDLWPVQVTCTLKLRLFYQDVVQDLFLVRGAHVLCDLMVSLNGYDVSVADQRMGHLWILDTGCEFSDLI